MVGLAVAGCTSTPDPPPPPPPDPDDALREAATARERGLLRAYDAALLADPTLAARLAPLRAHHAEHLAALIASAAAPATTPTPATPTPSTAGPSSAGPSAPAPAPAPAVALAALADAERSAAARRAEDAVAADDRALASLLAALAASEASHPVALA